MMTRSKRLLVSVFGLAPLAISAFAAFGPGALATTVEPTAGSAPVTSFPALDAGDHFTPLVGSRGLPLDPAVVDGLIKAGGYQLNEVASDGIEGTMPIGRHADNNIPSVVEGIWWISTNPFGGEILATFGGPATRYDVATRTVYQDNFGPGAYSYEADAVGHRAFLNVLLSKMVFAVTFTPNFQHADLRLSVDIFGQRVDIPDALLKYTMDLTEDGLFARHSWFFGIRVADYQLRRIVQADGTHDAAYAEYLQAAPAKSILAAKLQP